MQSEQQPEAIQFSPMPRTYIAWKQAARAFLLLTMSEHTSRDSAVVREAIAYKAQQFDAAELADTLLALHDKQLGYLAVHSAADVVGLTGQESEQQIIALLQAGACTFNN